MRNFVHCSLLVLAAATTFAQTSAPGRGTTGGPGPARPCAPGTTWNGSQCVGTPVGQAQAVVKGVAGVRVILGKQPGNSITLTPSLDGSTAGSLEGRFPPGTRIALLDAQGNIVSAAPVNVANGAFTLPPPRVPMQENFSACLQSPSVAQICSDPGALKALSAREAGSGQPTGIATGRFPNPTPGGGTPVGQAATLSAADAALLANVQITKANGTWRCTSTGGTKCSDAEMKLFTAVTKSRSNTKDNFMIDPDGALRCFSAADQKSCPDVVIQEAAAELKAVQQRQTPKTDFGDRQR